MSDRRAKLKAAAMARLPEGTFGRRMASAGLSTLRHTRMFAREVRNDIRLGVGGALPVTYRSWRKSAAPDWTVLDHQRFLAKDHPHGPTVHVIVVGRGAVDETLESLAAQTWPTWRASVEGHGVSSDSRIEYDADPVTALADGDPADLVVVLDAGDILRNDAVFEIVDAAWTTPSAKLVQWDDEISGHSGPRFRPSWSPHTLLSANYLGRSFALRRSATVVENGCTLVGSDLDTWRVLLTAELESESVLRIPAVLATINCRPDAVPYGAEALVSSILRSRGIPARAVAGEGRIEFEWQHEKRPTISIVIPTRHNRSMVGPCLSSIVAADLQGVDVVVIDNGDQTVDNENWYKTFDLDLTVEWSSDVPFNYSAVNNRGAVLSNGDVLVFLNDDTEVLDAGWLDELVGLAIQPEVGVVGVQLLDPEGRIQHGGVIIGIRGFADHLFAAMRPGEETLIGPTTWYRNTSSVTGACLAVTRDKFNLVGGFDERFELCGSDVAFGLQTLRHGLFNVVSPRHLVMHHESATRENWVPEADLFASWWRYQRHVRGGDRWWSPNLSLRSGAPTLRGSGEPEPTEWVSVALGREMKVFRQASEESETHALVAQTWIEEDRLGSNHSQAEDGPFMPQTINWWFPDIDSPFYGGINTALRLADYLAEHHGVENRLVVWGRPDERWIKSGIVAAFPRLADSPIHFVDGSGSAESMSGVPAADASIASLWITAYMLAAHKDAGRRHYLVQDYEPMFYPAGSLYAAAEETYRFGFHAICNTDNLRHIVSDTYGGSASSFWPSVDRKVFNAKGRRPLNHDDVTRIFVYARPGHWRNCWEMASAALLRLKREYGDKIQIVTAGSWARPDDSGTGIQHLGLLDVADTADLYRTCDVGVALTVSAHPSYLPLELMACGTPVVAFDNPAGHWILENGRNSRLCRRTPSGLYQALESMVTDPVSRASMGAEGLQDIDDHFSDWNATGRRVAEILADPEGTTRRGPAVSVSDSPN